MFGLFQRSVTAAEFGLELWDVLSVWPQKFGEGFKSQIEPLLTRELDDSPEDDANDSLISSPEDLLLEMVYLLSFGTDIAIHKALKQPARGAVRKAFGLHAAQFARANCCKPVPEGEWLIDSLLWQMSRCVDLGSPEENLLGRFRAYAAEVQSGTQHTRSMGESVARLLGGWCFIYDTSFLLYVTELFTDHIIFVTDLVKRPRIKA
jgi:hypothetical protein